MLPWSACVKACFCSKQVFGPAVCWPHCSLRFWPRLNIHRTGWANVADTAKASPTFAEFLFTEAQPYPPSISAWLVFQKGKYICLVLSLYCKPSLDLQSIYLSINLAFKSSQPLWESYHSWSYFPFQAASLSSEEEIWDSKFFWIIFYWKQSCSP